MPWRCRNSNAAVALPRLLITVPPTIDREMTFCPPHHSLHLSGATLLLLTILLALASPPTVPAGSKLCSIWIRASSCHRLLLQAPVAHTVSPAGLHSSISSCAPALRVPSLGRPSSYAVCWSPLQHSNWPPSCSPPQYLMATTDVAFRLFISGLAWSIDDRSLEKAFRAFRDVIKSKVIYDKETGRSRGFKFVTLGSEQYMFDAIEGMSGLILDGRSITVNKEHGLAPPYRRSGVLAHPPEG